MNSKQMAYSAVRTALKNGVLVRPDKCSKCKRENTPCADGRSNIHAHHHDYSKPLDVEWICTKCHRAKTPLPKDFKHPNFGSKNGFSKLNEKLAQRILSCDKSADELAHELGVHRTTIYRVRSGEHWRVAIAAATKGGK